MKAPMEAEMNEVTTNIMITIGVALAVLVPLCVLIRK